MRRTHIRIVLACLPLIGTLSGVVQGQNAPPSIYAQDPQSSQAAPPPSGQSVYEKIGNMEPMDRAGNPASADPKKFEDTRKQFEEAVTALNKAKDDVASRMSTDPQVAPLEKTLTDAKANYDAEIDDALSVLSWNDEYQGLIGTADKAGQALEFVTKNSPNDKQSIATAQRRFDDARKVVEDFEDDTLDQDPYVQSGRQTFITVRDARDKVLNEAMSKDLAVQSEQAKVDELKQSLDAMVAIAPKNAETITPPRRQDQSNATPPADQSATLPPPPVYDDRPAVEGAPLAEPEQPMVYDNGNSAEVPPPDYIPESSGGVYVEPPPGYVDPGYIDPGYAYVNGGPYLYLGASFAISNRYHDHHDHGYNDHDHGYYYHDRYSHGDYHDYHGGDNHGGNSHGGNNHGGNGHNGNGNNGNWNDGSNQNNHSGGSSGSQTERASRDDIRSNQQERNAYFDDKRAEQRAREQKQHDDQQAQQNSHQQEVLSQQARREQTRAEQSRRAQQAHQADAAQVYAEQSRNASRQRQADAQAQAQAQADAQARADAQSRNQQRRAQAEANARAQQEADNQRQQSHASNQQRQQSHDDGSSQRSSGSSGKSGKSSGGGSSSSGDRGDRYHR